MPRFVWPFCRVLRRPRRYYVRDGSSCSDASNATVALVHRRGINGARTACTFTAMTPVDANTFAYTESCQDLGRPEQYENTGTMKLLSPTSLWLDWDGTDGKGVTMTHCPQPSMPEPWRDTDLSSFIE